MRRRPPLLLALLLAGCLSGGDLVGVGDGPGRAAPARHEEPSGTPAASGRSAPASSTRSTPTVPLRPPAAPERLAYPTLQRQLEGLLADPDLTVAGPLALAVVNERGYPVFSANAHLRLLPASTMKVVTAAAALELLGPDFRYVTPLRATAPPDDEGVVDGDLVLVGSGDPALATAAFSAHAYPERPRTPIERLADAVVETGIRRVVGDVIGDPSVLADEPLAAGVLDRHLASLDMSRSSGLTVDYGLDIDYRDGGRAIGVMAADPAETAAAVLVDLLEERGVRVAGRARSDRAATEAPVEIGEVRSAPLSTLLRYAVQRSDNHLADGIFRTLGAAVGDPTWRGATASAAAALRRAGIDVRGEVLADGSGLSRHDRLRADLLAQLDLAMSRSEHAEVWRGLMAVAGQTGTLRRRLRSTLAHGRLRGKTGTLDDVRAFVGSVEGPGGRRFHLAVIGNDLAPAERDRVRLLTDEVALRLAEDLLGCVRTARTGPSSAQGGDEPREIVRCP